MKTLAFLNNKGGVGKTASVTTISHMLAVLHGKRVLIVDLDPQGNTSNLYGEMDFVSLINVRRGAVPNKDMASIGDALIDSDMDIHEAVKHTNYQGLDMIPSYPTLSVVEEKLKADIKRPQQFRLKYQLEKLKDEYDYCLIDCSPSLSILNVNALVASDEVYIPTLADDGSLFGIELTMTELVDAVRAYSPQLKVGGIFLTMHKENYKVSKLADALLKTVYADLVLPITINNNVAVKECGYEHKPLMDYDKQAKVKATRDYMELTEYILAPNKKLFLKRHMERT